MLDEGNLTVNVGYSALDTVVEEAVQAEAVQAEAVQADTVVQAEPPLHNGVHAAVKQDSSVTADRPLHSGKIVTDV